MPPAVLISERGLNLYCRKSTSRAGMVGIHNRNRGGSPSRNTLEEGILFPNKIDWVETVIILIAATSLRCPCTVLFMLFSPFLMCYKVFESLVERKTVHLFLNSFISLRADPVVYDAQPSEIKRKIS